MAISADVPALGEQPKPPPPVVVAVNQPPPRPGFIPAPTAPVPQGYSPSTRLPMPTSGTNQPATTPQPSLPQVAPRSLPSIWQPTPSTPQVTPPAQQPQPAPAISGGAIPISTRTVTPSDDPTGAGGINWTNPQPNAQGRSGLNPQQMQALPGLFKESGERWNVPPTILAGVMGAETDFGRNITTSSAGAKGSMQFIDSTAKQYGVDVNDVRSSVDGAAHYLSDLYRQYGDWPHALQAYNGALNDPSMAYARKVFAYTGGNIPEQKYIPASQMGPDVAERPHTEWGREPRGGYGDIPTPQQRTGLLQGLLPIIGLLSGRSGIAAAGVMTYYGNFLKGQQQGQIAATRLAQEQFALQVAEHNEQMQEENQAIGEALAIDPDGTKGDVMAVANKYNDNVLHQAIQMGGPTIEKLMQARDRYNTDLTKLHLSIEKERADLKDRQDFDNAVNADLRAWAADFKSKTGVDPNTDQLAQAKGDIEARRRQQFDAKGRAETATQQAAAEKDAAIQKAVAADDADWQAAHANATQAQKDQNHLDNLARRTREFSSSKAAGGDTNPYTTDGSGVAGDGGDQAPTDQAPAEQTPPAETPPADDTTTGAATPTGQPDARTRLAEAGLSDAATNAPEAQAAVAAATPDQRPPQYRQPDVKPTQMGPAMRRLNATGQEIARQYLEGGEGMLKDVETKYRAPILAGAAELATQLRNIPEDLSGKDVVNAVRQIDPQLGQTLDKMLRNKAGVPTGARTASPTTAAFWDKMINLATQADPGWNPDQFAVLHSVRKDFADGQQGKTLTRSFRLAQLAKQLWDDAALMPAGPVPLNEIQRWFESGVAGNPKYTKFALDWHNFAIESQAVVTGGQPYASLSRIVLDTMEKGANPAMIRQAIQSDLTASLGAIDATMSQWRQYFPEEGNPGSYNQRGYDLLWQIYNGDIHSGAMGGGLPPVGTVIEGSKYLGGDPNDPLNRR